MSADQKTVSEAAATDEECLPNFSVIPSLLALPDVPAITVSIYVENEYEARQYAGQYPDRLIYWAVKEHLGVWFTPYRRKSDREKVIR